MLISEAGSRKLATVRSSLLSEAEARACVARLRGHVEGARRELLRLYDGQGWRALGYPSWRACVVAAFGQSQAYLYRQLEAGRIEARISPIGEIGVIPASHLRPLVALPEDRQAEAYQPAAATATGRLSAAHIAAVVEQFQPADRLAPLKTSASAEWYTPPQVVAAAVATLGGIDFDPCAEEGQPKTVPAGVHYTASDDGLAQPWFGRVYLNPCPGR